MGWHRFSSLYIDTRLIGKKFLQIRGVMKIFKTYDELMEYVSNPENIETLESGEVQIKDWNDDAKALEKFKKDHGLATTDRKTLRGKNEELSKKVAELSEQLDSVNNELTGLKEVHSGGGMVTDEQAAIAALFG
jgi:predicted nuclease with TOPRIM domain